MFRTNPEGVSTEAEGKRTRQCPLLIIVVWVTKTVFQYLMVFKLPVFRRKGCDLFCEISITHMVLKDVAVCRTILSL